jgi:hypothetical protein
MNNTTKSKARYIKEWYSHIDNLNLLRLTPTKEISIDVENTINHLKELIIKIAEDKGLK